MFGLCKWFNENENNQLAALMILVLFLSFDHIFDNIECAIIYQFNRLEKILVKNINI